jgi:glycosyltransferase involved in cell wall biosynthesis
MIDRINNVSLSISMITYNQEKYISQAIDSVLMQNVNFKYEIVIGDDCSSDDTQLIIKKYTEKYPNLIKPVLRNKNVGALKNLDDVNKRCTGKYIITLEGDDYWTDSTKLQTQFDFLEANSEYSAVAHWCEVVDENGNASDKITNSNNLFNFNKDIYTLKDYQECRIPGHGNTILYKNIYLDTEYNYAKIYSAHSMVGDRTLYLILSLFSDIYIIHKAMSCYRFVMKKDESNFSSKMIGINENLIYYNYYLNLEKYVCEVVGKKISLRELKYSHFISSVISVKNNHSEENKYVMNAIFSKLNKYEMLGYIPFFIIKKVVRLIERKLDYFYINQIRNYKWKIKI